MVIPRKKFEILTGYLILVCFPYARLLNFRGLIHNSQEGPIHVVEVRPRQVPWLLYLGLIVW